MAQVGPGALEPLAGDFSCAIWGGGGKNAVVRVRFCRGAAVLLRARGLGLCFSNTLHVLRRVPEISNELDESYLGDFLLQGWCADASRTVYRDIRRLPAGHVMQSAKGEVSVRRFQKLPIKEPLRLKRPEDYVENYLDGLRAAVRDRMPAGPTALYLSGGSAA